MEPSIPISFKDMLAGVNFNKDQDENVEEMFDGENGLEDVQNFAKLDLLDASDDNASPLDKFKHNMTMVPYGPNNVQDNKLMKKIKKAGAGNCPTPDSYVRIHYMYYTEFNELPIDISYLRQTMPEKFHLESVGLIDGLKYAILSMRKGEKSDFFTSHEICFGVLGCPPRVPPKADLLFEVELIDFQLEDIKLETFDEVIQHVKKTGMLGKTMYEEKNIFGAIKNYRQAYQILFHFQANNEKEQDQLEELMAKFCRNLMICYNENRRYKQTCECVSRLHKYAPKFALRDVRIQFLWGKALSGLQEWDRAFDKLYRALKIAEKSADKKAIREEIDKASKEKSKYLKVCRMASSNFFSNSPTTTAMTTTASEKEKNIPNTNTLSIKNKQDGLELSDYIKLLEIEMSEFKMTDGLYELNLGSSSELSEEEMKAIENISKKMNLLCKIEENIIIRKII